MNKVLAVVVCLPAVLFGFIGCFALLSWLGPDGRWGSLLMGLPLVSGSVVCLWGAGQMWLGNNK